MLFHQQSKKTQGFRFGRAFKKSESPAIEEIYTIKEMNKKPWDGRIWDEDNNRWLPITTELKVDEEEKNEPEGD